MPRIKTVLAIALLASLAQTATADEPKWGDLTGQLIYDGEPPKPVMHVVAGLPPIPDESLAVDPETHGLAYVVVWLRTKIEPAQIHPDDALAAKVPTRIIFDGLRFIPRVKLVHTGQKLNVKNDSAASLSIKEELFKNGSVDWLIPPRKSFDKFFLRSETLPGFMGCKMRPWLRGLLFVRDNPYMAVTDAQGRFTIKNLPVGEHEFQFWQERAGFVKLPAVKLREAEVAGRPEKGRMLLQIQPGENNLGSIKLTSEQFK